jgi:outer membrane biosynthesis protein TonB
MAVVASVDSRPQPDARLERTAVQTTQQFASRRVFAVLETIQGLGRDANWYPVKGQLQATDGRVLVTVTVRSNGLSPDRRRDLATAVAAAYLIGR